MEDEHLKKGEIYEGVVEKIEFPNKGKVKVGEETVIVKNAIPGQKVRFMINKKRGKKLEGRLLEVLEKSPLEKREPVCSIFPACGGCMYQTMSYEDQLKMKAKQVKELLDTAVKNGGQVDENGNPDYVFEGIKGSPFEFAYRNKMEFSFGDDHLDGPLTLGLHKKASTYDILTVDDCKIVHDDFTACGLSAPSVVTPCQHNRRNFSQSGNYKSGRNGFNTIKRSTSCIGSGRKNCGISSYYQ